MTALPEILMGHQKPRIMTGPGYETSPGKEAGRGGSVPSAHREG